MKEGTTIEVRLRRWPAHVGAITACVLALVASANGASAVTLAPSPDTAASFHLGGNPLPPAVPPVQTAAPTGHYQVGLRTQDYRFQGHDLMVFFWYPAHHSPDATPYVTDGGIRGQAVVNAPLDRSGAKYPLILSRPGWVRPETAITSTSRTWPAMDTSLSASAGSIPPRRSWVRTHVRPHSSATRRSTGMPVPRWSLSSAIGSDRRSSVSPIARARPSSHSTPRSRKTPIAARRCSTRSIPRRSA